MVLVVPETWYVYTYAYPDGAVFYVGKGNKNRINYHEDEARLGCGCAKCNVIRNIWNAGESVQKNVVRDGLTESDALQYEKSLILEYAGSLLTNTLFNPSKKRTEKIILKEVSFSETVISGSTCIPVREVLEAFSLRRQRLNGFLICLHIGTHKSLFHKNQTYLLKEDVERIKRFIVENNLSAEHK